MPLFKYGTDWLTTDVFLLFYLISIYHRWSNYFSHNTWTYQPTQGGMYMLCRCCGFSHTPCFFGEYRNSRQFQIEIKITSVIFVVKISQHQIPVAWLQKSKYWFGKFSLPDSTPQVPCCCWSDAMWGLLWKPCYYKSPLKLRKTYILS